jgi:hypothetical protein
MFVRVLVRDKSKIQSLEVEEGELRVAAPTFGIRASRSEEVAAARWASSEVEAEGARRRLLAVRCR